MTGGSPGVRSADYWPSSHRYGCAGLVAMPRISPFPGWLIAEARPDAVTPDHNAHDLRKISADILNRMN